MLGVTADQFDGFTDDIDVLHPIYGDAEFRFDPKDAFHPFLSE